MSEQPAPYRCKHGCERDEIINQLAKLRIQRNKLLAAIEYALSIQSPHLAHEWLNDWTYGDEIAMAQLDAWVKVKDREARAALRQS